MDTFTAFVVTDLTNSVIVHDRYQNYDSAQLATLVHQLCCAHLLRDLTDAAQLYPDAVWPTQIADALRGLIHQANLARDQSLPAIAADIRNELLTQLRNGMRVGLSDTLSHGTRPGQRKARLLLELLRDSSEDVLRFVHDLKVPPTSHQAESDLRPSKIQQKTSGRLTSAERTQDRYTILSYLIHRRQTRPRQNHHPARRTHQPTLHARTTRTHLTRHPDQSPPDAHQPTGDNVMR